MVGATGIVAAVERTRLGAYLAAIREDEVAAESLGINTFRAKLAAMVLSACLTGIGGTFYANSLLSKLAGNPPGEGLICRHFGRV